MEIFNAARSKSKIDPTELTRLIFETDANYQRYKDYTDRLEKTPS